MKGLKTISFQTIGPWIGLCGIFSFALAVRFWGLNRFNSLVFDEIYYAKYAQNYLSHQPFFDAHPPMGKYMIALGIWLGQFFPVDPSVVNNLTGATHAPWQYRWLDALIGSFVPLWVAGIAYCLSGRWRYALLAGLFTALDGLLLVESRYALINISLIFWGLLGQFLFLVGLRQGDLLRRWGILALAGVCLGFAIAVKWNGLAFIMGLGAIWVIIRLLHWHPALKSRRPGLQRQGFAQNWVESLRQLHGLTLVVVLGVIPLLVYTLVWIPHLDLNHQTLSWVHEQMLGYHTRMKDGPSVHPYCSRWYTWPLMIRPMSYFYQMTRSISDPLPPLTPPLAAGAGTVIYDVHAMGNPFLWWFSAIALVAWLLHWLESSKRGLRGLLLAVRKTPGFYWPSLFILVNYGVNFLPWVVVSRCTFIYLYMGASIYGFLAIAFVVDQWLRLSQLRWRSIGLAIIFLIVVAFVYWLPIYLGLPLSQTEFRNRMWFNSWV